MNARKYVVHLHGRTTASTAVGAETAIVNTREE
jgi:hypothetical protein